MGGVIKTVEAGSLAAAAGLQTGDILLAINGLQLMDMIDYYFAMAESKLTLRLKHTNGQEHEQTLIKETYEDLGLSFTEEIFDGIRRCKNNCIFCFVDQLQPAPRSSLLIKDDDYRMSFLEGNFITAANLTKSDLLRIKEMRISPLYISVHATDEVIRGHLLGLNKPAPILPLLRTLIENGVQLHTQIVLIPGLNDGAILTQTIRDLALLFPGVSSIGIVPLGLTHFQKRADLRLGTKEEATILLKELSVWQKEFHRVYGSRLVFAADEFYIRASWPFPPAQQYEEFAQLENGIGMAALLAKEWRQNIRRNRGRPLLRANAKTAVVTGLAGAAALKPFWQEIENLSNGAITLLPVKNNFFGSSVTVSGLLTGSCLADSLPRASFERYIIPNCMLKHESNLFLDDTTVEELQNTLQTPITVTASNASGLFKALFSEGIP
ncbi:MAG: DUF512 domain-containing protein [Firmicutes bacterium]|nr:DUF512 domain-containing protein [Bacillota bacterium]